MNAFFSILVPIIVGYVLGAIPFAYLFGRLKGLNILEHGSGNPGTANAFRVLGKGFGFAVLFFDFGKGLLAPYLATQFALWYEPGLMFWASLGDGDLVLPGILAAASTILGHARSIWLSFKGGKSVACGVGTLFGLDWRVGLIVALIWGGTLAVSRIFSVAALVAIPLSIPCMLFFHRPTGSGNYSWLYLLLLCLLGTVYIVIRHQSNIGRLLRGEEPKI